MAITVVLPAEAELDPELEDIAALAPADDDVLQRKAGAWTTRSPAQVAADMGVQAADSDLTAIAALSPSDNDFIQRKSGAWVNRTPAQVVADLPIASGASFTSTYKFGTEF